MSRTKGDGALTEQWSGCAPIRSFLRVNRDLHRNRIITRFALGKKLGRCSPFSLSSMRFEDEKNFLPLRIHFYSILFARLIDNLLSRIRRKNKLIVLKYKYRRYILLFKKLTMDVFIASQTNRRKFVYVRHPLKLLRIRTKLGPKLYIDPPRRCSCRDHGRRGHGRRETFVSTNYKLLNWSDWSGPPVIRSTCRRSVSCRMRKGGRKVRKKLGYLETRTSQS